MTPRDELVAVFGAALDRVHAGRSVERVLPGLGLGVCTVIAAGKAAVAMAQAAQGIAGLGVRNGLIVTRASSVIDGFERIEAGHPVPDERSRAAAERALEIAEGLGADDTLLFLLSGGASALLAAPVAGVTLDDKRRLTEVLLRRDLDIEQINTVRRQLSRIKGGGLARAAAPARVVTLAVSDVRGDLPEVIGSGPTVGATSSAGGALAALAVLEDADLLDTVPAAIRAHLENAAPQALDVEPEYHVIANLADALDAARAHAESLGLRVRVLGRVLDLTVERAAALLADELGSARRDGIDLLVAGGEPTVEVRGQGRGGRAQQLALTFALEAKHGDYAALIAGTDGSDGPTDAAGALVGPETPARGARRALARNDAYPFLDAAGALLKTGPTSTNVNDLALVRVLP